MTPKKLDDNICELELLNISSPTYECIHSLEVKQGLMPPIVGIRGVEEWGSGGVGEMGSGRSEMGSGRNGAGAKREDGGASFYFNSIEVVKNFCRVE